MERFPVSQIFISGVMFSLSSVNGGGVKDVLPGFAYICGRCDGVGDLFRCCCSACLSCCSLYVGRGGVCCGGCCCCLGTGAASGGLIVVSGCSACRNGCDCDDASAG